MILGPCEVADRLEQGNGHDRRRRRRPGLPESGFLEEDVDLEQVGHAIRLEMM
jgi:hypothetical protein